MFLKRLKKKKKELLYNELWKNSSVSIKGMTSSSAAEGRAAAATLAAEAGEEEDASAGPGGSGAPGDTDQSRRGWE